MAGSQETFFRPWPSYQETKSSSWALTCIAFQVSPTYADAVFRTVKLSLFPLEAKIKDGVPLGKSPLTFGRYTAGSQVWRNTWKPSWHIGKTWSANIGTTARIKICYLEIVPIKRDFWFIRLLVAHWGGHGPEKKRWPVAAWSHDMSISHHHIAGQHNSKFDVHWR
jgi:hypothetical protein